jgi:hypothetical protein
MRMKKCLSIKTKFALLQLCFLFLFFLTSSKLFAQCTNSTAYMTVNAPTNGTTLTISSCTFQSEYNTINNVVAGQTYQSGSSCNGYITVRRGTFNGTLVANGNAPLTWTAPVAGTYYIHYNTNASCGTASNCCTTTITCTSCAGYNPCSTIPTLTCGTSVTANMSGSGAGWSITACGWSTPGQEMIYSFTPTTSGTHAINVTSATGGFVDYFWKLASAGCNNSGWNCIDDVFSAGTYGAMNWTAGTTYYILLDPEGTGSYSHTFNITCPTPSSGPCATIPNLSCGTSVTANMSGSGAGWNITACGWSTPGQEMIYSFTPSISGTYNINVTNATGGFVDYFWKLASGGCNNSGWNCIDDIFTTGSYGSMSWTAGVTYYILLDPEGTGSYSHTFNIVCPTTGGPVTASDCINAVNVCTNLNFQIDPNGYGNTMEIPPSGTVGNPSYNNPGGSGNSGCLLASPPERNSTWMIVNISTSGTLEFVFGGNGTQVGYYDWIMYPYNSTTCSQIPTGNYAPVRCNWNATSSGGTGIVNSIPPGGNAGNYEPALNVIAGQQYIICFSNWSSANTTVPLNFFGSASVSCSPLPIELLSFNGENAGDYNMIKWETLIEINNSHFNIEKSIDGKNFISIGELKAAGNSNSTISYNYADNKLEHLLYYYRLKQTDFDGQFTYTDIIAIKTQGELFSISEVYPNPFNSDVSLDVSAGEKYDCQIKITDLYGKHILSDTKELHQGYNKLNYNLEFLSKGFYHIQITDFSGNIHTRKFLKN